MDECYDKIKTFYIYYDKKCFAVIDSGAYVEYKNKKRGLAVRKTKTGIKKKGVFSKSSDVILEDKI